jgi:hypothetical protein
MVMEMTVSVAMKVRRLRVHACREPHAHESPVAPELQAPSVEQSSLSDCASPIAARKCRNEKRARHTASICLPVAGIRAIDGACESEHYRQKRNSD